MIVYQCKEIEEIIKQGKKKEILKPVSSAIIELTKDQYRVHEDDKNK